MIFQIKYYLKNDQYETIEEVDFENEQQLKRWYKKQWDLGKMKYLILTGWNYEAKKQINYSIRTW